MKIRKPFTVYLLSVALALGTGGLAALVTAGEMNLFSEVKTPPLLPPSWIFPVVWTFLYLLMGIGAAMIFLCKESLPAATYDALSVYAMNLVINFTWSLIFFHFRAFFAAAFWLILLWILILRMIRAFRKIRPVAAYLQIPYLVWVTFAGYLTVAIAILNR